MFSIWATIIGDCASSLYSSKFFPKRFALENPTLTRDDYVMAAHKNSDIENALFDTFEEAKSYSQEHIMTNKGKASNPRKPKRGTDGFLKGKRGPETYEELDKYVKTSVWRRNGASAQKVFNYYTDKSDQRSVKWVVFYIKSAPYYKK